MKKIILNSGILIIVACGNTNSNNKLITDQPTKTDTVKNTTQNYNVNFPKDTVIKIGVIPVTIKTPDQTPLADILVLPGWNYPMEKVCNESGFCNDALKAGYRLVLPDMMKSVYATSYFPETKPQYKKYLTLTWVTDTLITTLQKEYKIFTGTKNYLHGISTGARGAALVHLRTGKLFSKVVLLSGDYDQTKMITDNLMTNTYGSYSQYKERWEKIDNPTYLIEQWTADVYIGHGMQDDVVPVEQSINFETILKKLNRVKVISHYPQEAKHDFSFWGGENNQVIQFFNQ